VTSWSQAVPASEPAAWGYHQESPLPVQALPSNGISWTASEFIAHEKSAGWYLAVSLVGLLLAALDYFLTKDVVAVGAIVLTVLIFSTYAARKPRTQEYVLDQHGVHIGVKSYEFRSFKNFSVVHEGAIAGINFMPLKRFMPPLTIYVAPDMEDQVMSFLGGILPFEQKGSDSIDSLLRRIRF
jgi:hypothetical protein